MAETSQQNILGYAPIGKLLKSFAWPAIISMVANALYNVVDQIFIGNAVGYQGITAATVTFPIVTISIAVSGLIGIGSSAYAAILLGEGRREDAETVLNTQTTAGLFVGIVLMVLGLFYLDPLLRVFGATDATLAYSRDLGGVYILGPSCDDAHDWMVQYGPYRWCTFIFHEGPAFRGLFELHP